MVKPVLLLVLLTAVASHARAQSGVYSEIAGGIGDETFSDFYDGASPNGPLSGGVSVAGIGNALAFANVGFGVNRARATLNGTSTTPLTTGNAGALSLSYDTFTISDPELDGTGGTFSVRLYAQGAGRFDIAPELLASSDVRFSGRWEAGITLSAQGVGVTQTGFFGGSWGKPFFADDLLYEGDPLNAYTGDMEFAFVYGQPISIENYLETGFFTENLGETGGLFDASVDLGNSVYWGGISDVRDESGDLVGAYGYGSDSGYDYRVNAAPVPEPASLAILGVGALALLRRSRRR